MITTVKQDICSWRKLTVDHLPTKIFFLAKCIIYFTVVNLCQGQGSEFLN